MRPEADARATDCLASSAESGYEHYGMAFYSPPWSDRMGDIEAEWKARLKRLQSRVRRLQEQRRNRREAGLRQYDDAQATIGERGEVLRHGGRTERIQ